MQSVNCLFRATSPIIVKYNQLQYPEKEKHLKGMEFVDLFLFICISLFYFDIKIVWENNTSIKNVDIQYYFENRRCIFLILKKLKQKLKSCSKIYGCMYVVYILKLHDKSGKTSYINFGYQNRLQWIAAFYYR